MVKTLVKKDKKTGESSLVTDKRTLPKTKNPPRVKDLRYARNLPIECNDCPYRSIESGGNGICKKYKEDSVCTIRADIRKIVDKFDGERDSDRILKFMQAEFENNFEKLEFFEAMEDQSNTLDPEVTKRINALNNLGKVLGELKTKRESMTVTKKETLTDDMKTEIAQQITISKESMKDESTSTSSD